MQTAAPAPFRFTTIDGRAVEAAYDPEAFFCVCIGGVQIGEAADTPADAQTLIEAHLSDGVPGEMITVEAHRWPAGAEAPEEATPYYVAGRWHDAYPQAA